MCCSTLYATSMGDIKLTVIIIHTLVLGFLVFLLEKRLKHLHNSNIKKVPAEDSAALISIHKKLMFFVHTLILLAFIAGNGIIITLL